MKAVVILLLGVVLVSSCFAMPRKVLTSTDETQAHDKPEAMQEPASGGNGAGNGECTTGPSCTHHQQSKECFDSPPACNGHERDKTDAYISFPRHALAL